MNLIRDMWSEITLFDLSPPPPPPAPNSLWDNLNVFPKRSWTVGNDLHII